MIAFLKGAVAAVLPPSTAYIDVHGVGYAVTMAQSALAKLPPVGQQATVLTYLSVTENGIGLYGFLTEDEKAMFERLVSVSKVGPKMALAALSTFSPRELADAIAAGDVSRVSHVPGVGKKTAERIILELKGTLEESLGNLFGEGATAGASPDAAARAGAAEALLAMGFTSAEADVALKGAPEGASEGALLQYALKRLGGR